MDGLVYWVGGWDGKVQTGEGCEKVTDGEDE